MGNRKGLYQKCPLSPWNGGYCIFASHYNGTIRCFYGGETVISKNEGGNVEQPNILCPKLQMWKESVKSKREYEEEKGILLNMPTEEQVLTEGVDGTKFA